jgi:hypothetical protein
MTYFGWVVGRIDRLQDCGTGPTLYVLNPTGFVWCHGRDDSAVIQGATKAYFVLGAYNHVINHLSHHRVGVQVHQEFGNGSFTVVKHGRQDLVGASPARGSLRVVILAFLCVHRPNTLSKGSSQSSTIQKRLRHP